MEDYADRAADFFYTLGLWCIGDPEIQRKQLKLRDEKKSAAVAKGETHGTFLLKKRKTTASLGNAKSNNISRKRKMDEIRVSPQQEEEEERKKRARCSKSEESTVKDNAKVQSAIMSNCKVRYFSHSQIRILKLKYEENSFPSAEQKLDISKATGLTMKQIIQWFKDERRRSRKKVPGI